MQTLDSLHYSLQQGYTHLLFNVWISAQFQSLGDFVCHDSVRLPIHQALQFHNIAVKALHSGHLVSFGQRKLDTESIVCEKKVYISKFSLRTETKQTNTKNKPNKKPPKKQGHLYSQFSATALYGQTSCCPHWHLPFWPLYKHFTEMVRNYFFTFPLGTEANFSLEDYLAGQVSNAPTDIWKTIQFTGLVYKEPSSLPPRKSQLDFLLIYLSNFVELNEIPFKQQKILTEIEEENQVKHSYCHNKIS